MTELLYYECDICCTTIDQCVNELVMIERLLGEMLDQSESGPAEHLCTTCFNELRVVIMGWVHRKNE